MVRSVAVFLCLISASLGFGLPRVFIVQRKVSFEITDDPNRPLANLLASELDEGGKVQSVVWSLSDPVFRTAAMNGTLKNVPDNPTVSLAQPYAKILGAQYVAIVDCAMEGDQYHARLELFRDGKSIWKDDQKMKVTVSGNGDDDALRSLARTLSLRMNSEPLKGLTAVSTTTTPPPDPGQQPVAVTVTPPTPAPAKKDYSETIRAAKRTAAEGKLANAIDTLRQAADDSPLDPAVRIALVELLTDYDPELAAIEAHHALFLMPEQTQLRTLGAQAWVKAGKPEAAQNELNDAIAHDPDSASTRMLMGQAALAEIKPDRALEHLNASLAKEDSPEGHYLRGLCNAMLGNIADMKADLQKAGGDLQTHYDFSTEILDRELQSDANQVRSLMQRVVVKPDDRQAVADVEQLQQSLKGRSAFAETMGVPAAFKAPHEQRILAYRLMVQTLSDLQSFMSGGGEDALAGARIDLSEALRNASESKLAETRIRQKV